MVTSSHMLNFVKTTKTKETNETFTSVLFYIHQKLLLVVDDTSVVNVKDS
jgi:hypothetical protein